MTRNTLILLVSVLVVPTAVVDAFSPASFPTHTVAQLVKESQRFAPSLAMEEDDDDTRNDADEPAPAEDYLDVGDLESSDDNVGSMDDGLPPSWAVSAERIAALRLQYRRHDSDTGSPEFQVAGMTERISYLTKHLQLHPKDFSTRRGLVALVNKRRRLLNYLAREDVARYKELVASLGIRHKAAGLVPSREEPYVRFPKQKSPKKHLIK